MAKFLSEEGLRYFYNQIKSKFAAASHSHSAGNIISGTLPITRGGTGQTTAAGVRNALGLGNTTGALPVANGGTGATTAAQARANLGIKDIAVNGVDYIVETYQNGTKWYRVWASGLIEQGGFHRPETGGRSDITFLKPFTKIVLKVTLAKTVTGNDDYGTGNYPTVDNSGPTLTGFRLSHDTSGNYGTWWAVSGY